MESWEEKAVTPTTGSTWVSTAMFHEVHRVGNGAIWRDSCMLRRHDRVCSDPEHPEQAGGRPGLLWTQGSPSSAPTLAVAAGPSARPPCSGSLVPGGSGRYAENDPSSFTLMTFLFLSCPGLAKFKSGIQGGPEPKLPCVASCGEFVPWN